MSIYGTWTAKHYFAKTLQDYLPTEVAAINTEDPAGLVLTVPTTADVVTYSVAGEGQQWPFTVAPTKAATVSATPIGQRAPTASPPKQASISASVAGSAQVAGTAVSS